MAAKVTIPALQQMKRDGRKSAGVVAWDYQLARIADRAGVDFVSVGDSVGVNLWGHANPLEVTLDEMLVVCKAVRRGVERALVSCDLPFGPLQEGTASALQGRHPAGQGGRRRHDQARRRRRLPRGGARARARRHSGVRAVRPHPADRPEIRRALRRAERARRAGDAGGDFEARSGGEAAGGGRRVAARLHQFGPGGRRRGGASRSRSR